MVAVACAMVGETTPSEMTYETTSAAALVTELVRMASDTEGAAMMANGTTSDPQIDATLSITMA